MEQFQIDKRLEDDSTLITTLILCQVRLHHNAAFPWIILIPMQNNLKEIIDLSDIDQHQLLKEIAISSRVMQKLYNPTKLNVANLGNMVQQLHIHVIARYDNDKVWPNPIWNSGVTDTYQDQHLDETIKNLYDAFISAHYDPK